MTSNDFEIAPIGTRALLLDLAKELRGREEVNRAVAAAAREEADDASPEEKAPHKVRALDATGKADRDARFAGRIEALLAGWED